MSKNHLNATEIEIMEKVSSEKGKVVKLEGQKINVKFIEKLLEKFPDKSLDLNNRPLA